MGENQQRTYPQLVLIGPIGVGKTTVSELLGARMGLPVVCLDEIAGSYYAEVGFDDATSARLIKELGFGQFYRQLQPALAHATIRMIGDYTDGIMDLGAGHSHFADHALFNQVQHALAPCNNVVLLLPTADLQRSVEILRARSITERGWDWNPDGYDYIEHWVMDSCNHALATATIYTEGRTPEETCDEIIASMRATRASH
ncbi:MAG: hypothetical protein MUD01_20450 [Chloroflexaceae bacterium]|jgi:broad-specificity NMP kinase|nr:hypothetical protein [Chloroflexaceae bacterium]